MAPLPTDTIRCIADHCSLRDLCKLAAINKELYGVFTPMIYVKVRLVNRKSIDIFCNAIINGRLELRNYPRIISFSPRKTLIKVLYALSLLIRQTLLLTTNLVDLTLSLPSKVIKIIFRGAQYQFVLQRFSCPLITNARFSRFLLEQYMIQDLVILRDVRGTINVGTSIQNSDRRLLPNLCCISANYEMLRSLIPGRPIISVSTGVSLLEVPHFQTFGAILAQSSAQIHSLSVCISCAPFLLGAVTNHLFETLEENHVVPNNLAVTIVFPERMPLNSHLVSFKGRAMVLTIHTYFTVLAFPSHSGVSSAYES
jgi:hypothetical protein